MNQNKQDKENKPVITRLSCMSKKEKKKEKKKKRKKVMKKNKTETQFFVQFEQSHIPSFISPYLLSITIKKLQKRKMFQ